MVEPSRGKKVVEGFLGAFRPDFWVSDRYGGQMGWAKMENQVCLAHLIRDVQYAIDAGDAIFAPDLRHLLGRSCRIGRRRDKLADTTLKTYAARLEARLDKFMARTPTHAAGVKLRRVIKKIRGICSSSSPIAPFRPPTMAPNERRAPASFSAKSPMASAPAGARVSTPAFVQASKPHAAEPLALSRRSASPSQESLFPQGHSWG
jgi:hypothetical protein